MLLEAHMRMWSTALGVEAIMSLIIMMNGLPLAGKTYTASRITELTGLKYISSNYIRKEIGADDLFDERVKDRVYDELVARAEYNLRLRRSVILDATFNLKKRRKQVYSIIRENDFLAIKCICSSEEEVQKRLQERKRLWKANNSPEYQGVSTSDYVQSLDEPIEEEIRSKGLNLIIFDTAVKTLEYRIINEKTIKI